jgi:hypothetical protein
LAHARASLQPFPARDSSDTHRHNEGPATTPITPRLLNRSAAAAYLGLSLATLDALRSQGEISPVPVPAAHRVGVPLRVPLFDIRDLDAAVDRWKTGGVA